FSFPTRRSSDLPNVFNLIPSYKIIDTLGWVNTPWAMIVPGLAGMGNIFLVRQFMLGLPKDLDESARMDGANHFQIYSRIILPLVKPILIVCRSEARRVGKDNRNRKRNT